MPNFPFDPPSYEHLSAATTLIPSRGRRQKWRNHDRKQCNSKHSANLQIKFSDKEFSSDDDTADPLPKKKQKPMLEISRDKKAFPSMEAMPRGYQFIREDLAGNFWALPTGQVETGASTNLIRKMQTAPTFANN